MKNQNIKHAAPRISRRRFLRGATAATATAVSAAAVGPWVVSSRALAAGELNILMWSDYLPEDFLAEFTDSTGIKVNYTGIGSNEEIINKMKATKGRGVDICSPTNLRSGQWVDLDLLQPFDYGRIKNLENVNKAMLRVGDTEWNFGNRGSHWLPHIWGTEAIGWRTELWAPDGDEPSYGDIWQPAVRGKTMCRPHSGMLGAGLYMETIGELEPGDMWKAYRSEALMRPIWAKVTDWCIARKAQIKLFWNDADSQKNGLLNEGVVVGQTWDGPPLALKSAGEPVNYQAPKEGAMAWVDGMSLSAAAENTDAVYEFIDFCYRPKPAGEAIDKHGYNSAVIGADKFAGDTYKKNFSEAYPGNALANLNPWPLEPQWYADVRTEYRNRFVNA